MKISAVPTGLLTVRIIIFAAKDVRVGDRSGRNLPRFIRRQGVDGSVRVFKFHYGDRFQGAVRIEEFNVADEIGL